MCSALLQLHLARRVFETQLLAKPSAARMHGGGWLFGLLFYAATAAAFPAALPGAAEGALPVDTSGSPAVVS